MQNDRDSIIQSIEQRNASAHHKSRWKMALWAGTVWFAYFIKRVMDIGISLTAIILLSPIFLTVALAVRFESRGTIIFKQVRVGKNGRHFNFYKFRSMYVNADALKQKMSAQNESKDGVIFKMKHDPRVTRVGRFIRKYSIDELPQLFNVLSGDMSLVGPRPPVPSEVKCYTLEDRKRLHIKPGITCIWQVSGRSDIPFRQQVCLDEQYIKNHGFWRDILLLLKTIPAVITGKGAY